MMASVPVTAPMTAAEYLAAPLEGRRTELIDGVVVVHNPRPMHQYVLFGLATALWSWTSERPGRGRVTLPLDVAIDDRNVFGPDLLWYADGRAPTDDDAWPYALPDLAVEVRSPSTWRYDIGAKKSGYERNGLPELWLVDTAADEMLVFRRSAPKQPSFDVTLELARADALMSPMLPGFALQLADLFPN